MARINPCGKNLVAFLDMLAFSEGTLGIGDDGYNVLVGSRKTQGILFTSYADHPRLDIRIRRDDPSTPQNEALVSTAAGRYQLLARWFDPYKKQLNLRDFSPIAQDLIAIQQIRECGSLAAIDAGNLVKATSLCSRIWASLPGAGYGQHENKLASLMNAYIAAGGVAA